MTIATADLTGRRILVPGGSGTVGTGVVRRYLAAGADVVVPTRTQERADEFRARLSSTASDHLHVVVHDYTSFEGAETLAATMQQNLGGIDDVVAPIGGWWAGGPLTTITEADWQHAFVDLATTHMATARAALPRMTRSGAYVLILGQSATWPVPGSGLVSMEQAAVLMLRRVLEAEGHARVFALVLGPVSPSVGESTDPLHLTADLVGDVAIAASTSWGLGRHIDVVGAAGAAAALGPLLAVQPV